MGPTCMQRVARKETSSVIQTLTNQQMGHGHRRNNERDFRRHLLASSHAKSSLGLWKSVDSRKYRKYKLAKIQYVMGWIWVSYPDSNSAGNPRMYKNEFLQLDHLGILEKQTHIGKTTLGPVEDLECVTYRKSMSTSAKEILVTLTHSGYVTCTEIVSPMLIRAGYQRCMKDVETNTRFTQVSWDEHNDRLIILQKTTGGGARAIYMLDVEDLSTKTTINFAIPNLQLDLVEDMIFFVDQKKGTVGILSVYALCKKQTGNWEGVHTVTDKPTPLAIIPTTKDYLNILDSFWPPLFISRSETHRKASYNIHDFRLDRPILEIPCEPEAMVSFEEITECSRAVLFKDDSRHKLYKIHKIEMEEVPQYKISEEEPFDNPLPIPDTAPSTARRSTRVRRSVSVAKEPTVVYSVQYSAWLGMYVVAVQEGGSIKLNFYERRNLKHCNGINLPVITLPKKVDIESILDVQCVIDSEYLTARVDLPDHTNILYYISLLTKRSDFD